MPTLYRWFQNEYARLGEAGKGQLAEEFEAYRSAYFDYDYASVLAAIPRLQQLCDQLDEPAVRLLVDYYLMTAEAYWMGNLARGMDIATRTLIQARRTLGGDTIPELYTRLSLFYKWLDTDGPGYAEDVLKALKEIPDNLPRDLALRFELVHAYAVLQIDPVEGFRTILGIIPRLGYDWPEGYRRALRAEGLLEVGRYDEALDDFMAASQAFEDMNHHIQAVGMQIGAGEAYLRSDHFEQAERQLTSARSAADRTMNRALSGSARGLLGQALAEMGAVAEGISSLDVSLDRLDGLGWLRMEAEFSIARWQIAREHQVGQQSEMAAWQADAIRRASRLRSDDLIQTLQDSGGDELQ